MMQIAERKLTEKQQALHEQPMTAKQSDYMADLIKEILQENGDLYITGIMTGRGSGDIVPVQMPPDYDYKITFTEQPSKLEGMECIQALNAGDFEQVQDATAKKIQINNEDISLYEYMQGERLMLGVEGD